MVRGKDRVDNLIKEKKATEKLKPARGNRLYEYVRDELNTHQAESFSEYFQKLYREK